MTTYPTAEEELKQMTVRFWAQVEISERVIKERDEAKELLQAICSHLVRDEHAPPATDGCWAAEMISRLRWFLSGQRPEEPNNGHAKDPFMELLRYAYIFLGLPHKALRPWRITLENWQKSVEAVTGWNHYQEVEKSRLPEKP